VEKRPARYGELRQRAARGGSSEFVWGANTRTCGACGTESLPEAFTHCGVCGTELSPREPSADQLRAASEITP
jgi:hypothetical protein